MLVSQQQVEIYKIYTAWIILYLNHNTARLRGIILIAGWKMCTHKYESPNRSLIRKNNYGGLDNSGGKDVCKTVDNGDDWYFKFDDIITVNGSWSLIYIG